MGDTISASEIEAGIPEKYRRFFSVEAAPLPTAMQCLVDAFWTAARCAGEAAWFLHPIHVVFGTAPFRLILSNCELEMTPNRPGIINLHVEHMVFLDCNKMMTLGADQQVVCILEELVHSIMHISDESLVRIVVCALYPAMRVVDGKYTLAAQSSIPA